MGKERNGTPFEMLFLGNAVFGCFALTTIKF